MRYRDLATAAALVAAAALAGAAPARAEAKNRAAFALDATTFVTVKDDGEWEYVHLYRVEDGGKLVLVDSAAVRQDHQVDRLIEFRRTGIEKKDE